MGSSANPPAPIRLLRELAQVRRILGSRGALRYLACVGRRLPSVLARRSLGPADGLMPLPLTLRSRRGPLRVNSGDFGVVREIFGSLCYDYADWIERSRRFLDLGANEGLFSLYALAADPANRVTAMEAQPSLCERLHANLHSNGWEQRARVICGLAGGSNRQLEALAETASGVVNMDALLEELGGIDFLKVDIEGSEFALFEDCGTWIDRVHYIAMEVHHDCGDSQALQRRLREQGLVVRHEGNHRELGYLFVENPDFRA
jgi:hypothetical protein